MSSAHSTPEQLAQDILHDPLPYAIFLALDIKHGHEQQAISTLSGMKSIVRALRFHSPESDGACVVGISSDFFDRIIDPAKAPKPSGLHSFQELRGATHYAPSTQGDLFFHIKARSLGTCYQTVRRIVEKLIDATDNAIETHAYSLPGHRNHMGFVDGTESPQAQEAVETAFIDSGLWAGGSFQFEQKYVIDTSAWQAVHTNEQEHVIGRTKTDDVELDPREQRPGAHVRVNVVRDATGASHRIVRHGLNFGTASGDHGTFFIAYSKESWVPELMLKRMVIGEPEGNYDRILDFARPVTGSLYFVPPTWFFERLDSLVKTEFRPEKYDDPTQPATMLPSAEGIV